MKKNNQQLTKEQIKEELWRRGTLKWKFHPLQTEIYNKIIAEGEKRESTDVGDDISFFIALCSRQIGKSYMGVALAIEACLQIPNYRVAIVAPSEEHAKSFLYDKFDEVLCDYPASAKLLRPVRSKAKWSFTNGSEIIVGGFDTAIKKFRGKKLNRIILEEFGFTNPETCINTLRAVLFPTFTHTKGFFIVLSTPSEVVDHPLHTLLMPEAQKRGALFTYTIYDNPLLSSGDVERIIREQGGLQSPTFRREYLCEIFRDSEMAVLPNYNKNKHSIPIPVFELPERCKPIVVTDWGGVKDKTATLLMYWDQESDKIKVLEEIVEPANTTHITILKHIRELLRRWNLDENRIQKWVDAHGDTRVNLPTCNYSALQVPKTDWAANLQNLNSAFYRDEILINSSGCPILASTASGARFTKSREDFERTVEFGHCDALIALMYGYRVISRQPYLNNYLEEKIERIGEKNMHIPEHLRRNLLVDKDERGFKDLADNFNKFTNKKGKR